MNAILPDGLKLGDFRQQRPVLRVQAITEQMDFSVVVLGGQFGAGNEINARSLARCDHAWAALHRVMVGQGKRGETVPVSMTDQFLRRKRSVGEVRVQM